jgi:hypothetical protein
MPIKIYAEDGPKREIAWLCDEDWQLPTQVSALEVWLAQNSTTISSGRYIADIGFSVRSDAAGGGAVISPEMMRAMADLGMTLFLSEYPGTQDAPEQSTRKA